MSAGRILGIDFGEKRIGLALSDPLGFTAQGFETLIRQNKKQVLEDLGKICRENEVKEIVIGLPVNMDGTLGPKAREVAEFAAEMEKALSLPVKSWDERLSSRQAGRLMHEGGLSSRRQRQKTDRVAAVILLQSYLESKRMEKA